MICHTLYERQEAKVNAAVTEAQSEQSKVLSEMLNKLENGKLKMFR